MHACLCKLPVQPVAAASSSQSRQQQKHLGRQALVTQPLQVQLGDGGREAGRVEEANVVAASLNAELF